MNVYACEGRAQQADLANGPPMGTGWCTQEEGSVARVNEKANESQ